MTTGPGGPGRPAVWRTRVESWARSWRDRLRGWHARERSARFIRVTARITWFVERLLLRWSLRIGLPLLSVAVVLRSFPFQTTAGGLSFRVEGTLVNRPGLSADTTLGNWEFPSLDGLPFGVHVSPQNVDIVALGQAAASSDVTDYAQRLESDLRDRLPEAIGWLLAETVFGLLVGLAAAAAVNMAVRYLRGLPRRPDEVRHRLRQLGAAAMVTVFVVGYGVFTYNENWLRQSRLTGTLAAAKLFPDQLQSYYENSKALDVLGSVVSIQGALQDKIELTTTPGTALRIMFISDVHLAAVYPLVARYVANYDVNLIINTGDETEFATKAELTPAYLKAIRAVTSKTPMLWLAGNHDSPDVESVMAKLPGVTVLGHKQAVADGYAVSAGVVQAYGLQIAGLPDPRVYGGPGAYGSNTQNVTDPLERSAADQAVSGVAAEGQEFDIFATHEPVAALELRKQLPKQIRQTNSGHLHAQNATQDIQSNAGIDLVEGSTGAGGLDNLVRGVNRPPVEFSIESVAANCQFTRVLRFQIRAAADNIDETAPQPYGDDVTLSTEYFRPQQIKAERSCGLQFGLSADQPL